MNYYYFLLIFFLVSCISDKNENLKEKVVNSSVLNIEGNIYKLKGELFTGKVLDTAKNGRVLKSFTCFNGKIEGEFLNYSTSGKIISKRSYKNGLLDGESTFYENESVSIRNYKKGILNGNRKELLEGKVLVEGFYKDGLQCGIWTYNYPNGKIKIKGQFENGDESNRDEKFQIPRNGRIGEWVFYSENGNIEKKHFYKHDSDIVDATTFYENGKIHWKGTFSKISLEETLWVEYSQNGKIIYKNPKITVR
jgi:antitoxin component YwqK of YwqJK toxin-antitoxin module